MLLDRGLRAREGDWAVSYDTHCYDLAKFWLEASGWNHDATIRQLAQRIQDTCEDFEAELENGDG